MSHLHHRLGPDVELRQYTRQPARHAASHAKSPMIWLKRSGSSMYSQWLQPTKMWLFDPGMSSPTVARPSTGKHPESDP
eukprot:scaffold1220_cov117-Isochrysis_galbana.AAC.13